MNSVTNLDSSTGRVSIFAGDKDWCPCVLLYQGGSKYHYLGAESLGYITGRLLPALTKPWAELENPVAGEVQGHEIKWVLSLSEAHGCLYVASDGENRLLFWQDAHGSEVKWLCSMRLSPEDRSRWGRQLEDFANR